MRIYYGWIIVAMTMVILMLLVGCVSNSFGLFVLPVSEDLGLSRGEVNTGYILTVLGGAVAAPFIGRLIDVYPVRRIMLISAVLFAGGLITVGLSRSAPLSAVMLAGPVALGMGGVGAIGSLTIVARWFGVNRGRAMAIAMMGMSLGSILVTPMVSVGITSLGWRHTMVLIGVLSGGVFLLAIAFLRERPKPGEGEAGIVDALAAAQTVGEVAEQPKKTLEIVRLPLFWMPALACALSLAVAQAVVISLVPIAQEAGIGVTQAATLISVLGAMSIAGKFLLVWVGNKVRRSLSLAVMSAATAIVSALLIAADGYPMLMVSSAFLGLAVGAITPALLTLLAESVGAASFGSANGISALLIAVLGAAAMRAAGDSYDITGGYELIFTIFIAVSLLSMIMLIVCWRLERRRNVAPA